jgi:urate oxidase
MYNKLIDSSEVPSGSSLAAHDSVKTFVYQMLTIASAGGMSESRAEKLHEEILGCYANLDGSALEAFRNDFLKILNSTKPDRN